MTLDQIIADALEQLPEAHVRRLAEEVVRLRSLVLSLLDRYETEYSGPDDEPYNPADDR